MIYLPWKRQPNYKYSPYKKISWQFSDTVEAFSKHIQQVCRIWNMSCIVYYVINWPLKLLDYNEITIKGDLYIPLVQVSVLTTENIHFLLSCVMHACFFLLFSILHYFSLPVACLKQKWNNSNNELVIRILEGLELQKCNIYYWISKVYIQCQLIGI